MITPTVGRIVHYHPSNHDPHPVQAKGPLAALITHVQEPDNRYVNLCVFSQNGTPMPYQDVVLVQPEQEPPPLGRYCTWMPYQIKKGHGSEHDG